MRIALMLLVAAAPLAAQPKNLVNAQVDTRSAAAGLESVFRTLNTSQPQPAWIAYSVPASGRNFGCDSYWRDGEMTVAGGTVYLEAPKEVLVLYRLNDGKIGKVRTLAPGCDIDAGGAPVHWLTNVRPAESVAFLVSLDSVGDSSMNAIALHGDQSAQAAIEKFVAPTQPESVRQKAAHWLSFDALKKLLATDPSERVRERALQALPARQPEAVDLAIATARTDRSPRVRGQALSWLARQASKKAIAPIQQAIDNDPEREVKRRAVSALQQMPDNEGIPLLIQLARTSRDTEVRKQAMSSLGQSRDQRAIAFFEDVLKAKP